MQPGLPLDVVTARDKALQQVAQHAEDHRPDFLEDARAFVVSYLRQHGPTPGEVLTLQCKADGIAPHDDRAFGAVYALLARRKLIVQVGEVKRLRGHGTAGGRVWDLAR